MYAGFWNRFLAHIIDTFIVYFLLFLLIYIGAEIETLLKDVEHKAKGIIMDWGMIFLTFLLLWLYHAWFECSKHQGTVGKLAMRIIVVDKTFNQVSFWKASVRFFSKIISSFFIIGYLIAAFTDKKQALHDFIPGTYVINEKEK